MYNKEELLAKDSLELENIAKELDVQFNPEDNKESVVYAILDKQAEMPNVPAKRKRTRITKKEDHVYSVSGAEGANYDVMKNHGKQNTEQPLFKELGIVCSAGGGIPARRHSFRTDRSRHEKGACCGKHPVYIGRWKHIPSFSGNTRNGFASTLRASSAFASGTANRTQSRCR